MGVMDARTTATQIFAGHLDVRRLRAAGWWGMAAVLAWCWLLLGTTPAAAQIEITPNSPCFQSINFTDLTGGPVRGITNQPVISGNGARIAFWSTNNLAGGSNGDGNIEIFVGESDSGAITQLTRSVGSILGGFNLEPSISDAGTHIAFYSDRDLVGSNADGNFEIFLARRANNGNWSITQVTNTTGSANLFPSINADGTRIAFVSDDAELHNVTPVVRNNDRNFEIFLATIPTTGSPQFRQITNTGREITNDEPVINAAGTRVAFSAGAGQSSQVFVWNATGGAPIQLTQTGVNDQPAINTDGTRIVYISTTADDRSRVVLHTLSADGSESRAEVIVPAATNTTYRSPSISGNGARVVYVAEQGTGDALQIDVFLYDLNTKLAVPISEVGGGTGEQPVLSADGTRASFVGVRAVGGSTDDAGSDIYLNECPLADLALAVRPPVPATVLAGVDVHYTLLVTNHGPSIARDAYIRSDRALLPGLPSHVTPLLPAGCAFEGNILTCALGDLPVGGTRTLVIGYDVPSNAELKPIVSVFSAGANAVDSRPNNAVTVTTTIYEEAALALTVTPDVPVILAGSSELLTYDIRINNAGPSQARNVILTDTLPVGAIFVSAALVEGGGPGAVCPVSANDTRVVCQLGNLAGGGSARVQIKIRAKASAPATFTNVATVRTATAEPNLANNTVATTTTVDRSADMQITKSASATSVVAGTELTYTLVFTNAGLAETANAFVTDLLPSHMVFVRDTSPAGVICGADASKTIVTCTAAGTLPVGAVRTARFTALVESDAPLGTISNTASIQSLLGDPFEGNNTSTVETQVTQLVDLVVDKTLSKSQPNIEEVVTFTVTVRNEGPSEATTVVVTDALPISMTYVSHVAPGATTYDQSTGRWTIARLRVGAQRTLVLHAAAISTSGGQTLTNTAVAVADQPERTPADNTAFVTLVPQSADLRLTLRANPSPVLAGQPLAYTLLITNTGPTRAIGVVLTDTLPSGVVGVTLANPPGRTACERDGLNVTCVVGLMSSGQVLSYTVVITREQTGAITNLARVTSSTPDIVPGNNTASVNVTVNPDVPAKLDFFKQPPGVISAGSPFGLATPIVHILDRFDNLVTTGLGATDTITLQAYQDALCNVPTTPVMLQGGEQSAINGVATFLTTSYTRTGEIYLKAVSSRNGVAPDCSTRLIINPDTVKQLIFKTEPRTMVAGTKSLTMTVERQDEFGNPTMLDSTVVLLREDSPSVNTFLLPDQVTLISSVTIVTGTSTASFVYSDTAAGVYTITADSGTLVNATQQVTVTAAPAKDLLVIPVAPPPFTAGTNSDLITVQRTDPFGNPNSTDPTTVISLTSDSSGIYSFTNDLGSTQIVTVAIQAGDSTTFFRYNDTLASHHTLMAADVKAELVPASVEVEVLPAPAARLLFTNTARSITAGTLSGVVTVARQDRFGNYNALDAARVVTLTSSSAGDPTFRLLPGGVPVPSVTIAAGDISANFFYSDTLAGTHVITGSSPGVIAATQLVTVTAADAVKLVAITPPHSTVAGTPSPEITIQRQDVFNNPAPNGGNVTVELTSNSTGTKAFLETVNPITITQVVITNTDASFRYRDTAVRTWTLTLSDGGNGLIDTAQAITITPAATAKLIFTTRPVTMTAGTVSTAFVVERQDDFGNPTLQGNLMMTLTTSSAGLATAFCHLPSCVSSTTQTVVISDGVSATQFYYKDTLAGTHQIRADSGGGRSPAVAFLTVKPDKADRVAFITVTTSMTAGVISNLFTVQVQDTHSNAVTPTASSPVTVALSTSNLTGKGKFRNAANTADITTLVMTNTAAASFRYTDTVATLGGPQVTLAIAGQIRDPSLRPLDGDARFVTVRAAPTRRLVFTTGPFTTEAGQPTGVLTLERLDAFGNRNTTDAPLRVTLTTGNPATGDFIRIASPTLLPGNQITITGSFSATFRYEDTLRGSVRITATAASPLIAGAVQTQTIIGGTAARLKVFGSSTQVAGTAQTLTLRAFDTYGNLSDVYTGTKGLSFTGANVAVGGQPPYITGQTGITRTFGVTTNILFHGGVATVSGEANGMMRLFRAETAIIGATDGSISAAAGDRLTVTVVPAPRTLVRAETQADGSGGVVPSQTMTAGLTIRLHAIGRDPYLNVSNSPVTATWQITRTGGITTTDLAPVNGVTSTVFTARQVGTAVIVPTFPGLASIPSGLLMIDKGPAMTVSVETAADGSGMVFPLQTISAGTSITLYAVTRDAFGNHVGSPAATWTLTNTTGGVISSDLSPAGDGSFAVLTGHKAGSAQVIATVGGVPNRTPSQVITVVAGDATRFQVNVPTPLSFAAGVTKTLAITAFDAFGNPAIGYTGLHTLTFTGANPSTRPVTPPHVANQAGALIPFGQPTSLHFNAGVLNTTGIAGDMRLFHAETATIHAADGPITGTSALLTVGAGAHTQMALETAAATVVAGVPFSVTTYAEDAWGNNIPGYTNNVSLRYGSPQHPIISPSSRAATITGRNAGQADKLFETDAVVMAFSGGVAAPTGGFNGIMKIYRTGNFTITVREADGSPVSTSAGNLALTVLPNPAQALALSLNSPVQNGVPFSAGSLLVRDLYQNPILDYNAATRPVTFTVTGVTGTIKFAGPARTHVLDQPTDFTAGIADLDALGMVYQGTAGTATIRATAPALTGGTIFTTTGVLVQPGPPQIVGIRGRVGTASLAPTLVVSAGTPISLEVRLLDAAGNTATTSGLQTLTFAGAPLTGGMPPNPTVSSGTGSPIHFGTGTGLNFTTGVAMASGANNGILRIYQAGVYTVTASGSVAGQPVATPAGYSFQVIVQPGPLNSFGLVLDSPQTVSTGFTGVNTLTPRDPYQNTINDFHLRNTPVTLTVTSPSTGTVVLVNSGNDRKLEPVDFVNGVADLTGLGLRYSGPTGVVTLRAAPQSGTPFVTSTVQIDAGALDNYVLAATGPITAGAGQPYTVTLTARDGLNNVVATLNGPQDVVFTGASVNGVFVPTANGAAFNNTTSVTFVNGVATVTLLFYQPEVAVIQAVSGIVASNLLNVPVVPGALGMLDLALTSPQTSTVAFVGTNTLTAYDGFGNRIDNFATRNIPVTLTVSGPSIATLVLVNSGNDRKLEPNNFVDGVANLTTLGLRYTGLSGPVSLVAAPESGSPFGSALVQMQPGPLAQYTLAPVGVITATAGQAYDVTLTARDEAGNVVTGVNGNQAVLFTGASASGSFTPTANGTNFDTPVWVNFTDGMGVATLLLYKVESAPVVAAVGALTTDPLPIPIVPGPLGALDLVLTGPQTSTLPFTGTNTLTARDGYGNRIGNFAAQNIPVLLSVSGPTTATLVLVNRGDSQLAPNDFVNGIADLTSLGLRYTGLSGIVTLVATAQGGTPTGLAAVQINPGPPAALRLAATGPLTATAGESYTVTLTLWDSVGNVATSANGSQNVLFTGASASGLFTPTANGILFGGPTPVVLAGGVSTVTLVLYRAEEAPIQVVAGTLPSNLVTVTVAPSTTVGSFAFSLTSPQNSGAAFGDANTLTALDPYGNVAVGFDAAVNPVNLTSVTLAGTISGLGSNGDHQLNRFADFDAGVADLTVLGMTFTRLDGGVDPADTVFRAELQTNPAISGDSAPVSINP